MVVPMRFCVALMGCTLALTIAEVICVGNVTPYHFMKSGHPIDMVMVKGGHWFYYFEGGLPAEVATNARAELKSQGFAEDSTHRPWYHFSKGDKEVIVCNFDEIGTRIDKSGTSLFVMPKMPTPKGYDPSRNAVVWVHERGGSQFQHACFTVKKTALLW
jgi:hypothetical protein